MSFNHSATQEKDDWEPFQEGAPSIFTPWTSSPQRPLRLICSKSLIGGSGRRNSQAPFSFQLRQVPPKAEVRAIPPLHPGRLSTADVPAGIAERPQVRAVAAPALRGANPGVSETDGPHLFTLGSCVLCSFVSLLPYL